jgi:hypothetical protein
LKDTLGGNLHDLLGDPRRYLSEHFTALRDFYTTAAGIRLAIVVWCGGQAPHQTLTVPGP